MHSDQGSTALLAQWAAAFRLDSAPDTVVQRMKALVLDYFRVVAVGARLPWSRAARTMMLGLGGQGTSTVLLYGDRLDAARAAFVNGAFAHGCDIDDTHVGSMHHAGASILPAVFAVAEKLDADGKRLLEAAIIGYEASLRIGLAVSPTLFHRGFMPTPTCGAFGAALAVGRLMGFNAQDLAGTLGAASSYAGGLAQFYKSGSIIKRINGGRAAESGVLAATLVQHGIWGPRDILEGEAGFFRAFSDSHDPTQVSRGLGQDFRLMEVSTKAHAGAGRLQASADAGLRLASEHHLQPADIVDVEVGIPQVIQARLTQALPPDLQSAQMSVPFGLAISLAIGRTRGAAAGLRPDDFEAGLASEEIRALAQRVRCVLDPDIEKATTTEEVPSRVTVRLRNGAEYTARVDHPRGSPARQMSWDELSALFTDAIGDALPQGQPARLSGLIADLDGQARPREIIAGFIADPKWLEETK